MKNNATPNSSKTKKLVIAALFAALSLALKPFTIYLLPTARLSFIDVPIILSGIMLGPVWGAAVGVVADISGYLFFDTSGAALNVFITAAKAVIGFVPGLIFYIKRSGKKINCNLINVCSYVILLAVIAALCMIEGTVAISDGTFGVMSPASGEFKVISWWIVAAIGIAFILYSVVIIRMLARKGKEQSAVGEIASYVLLSVTLGVLIGNILIEGTALAVMYGWKLSVMYPVKIAQSFLTIPVYSLLCSLLYPVIEKQKL